jgi:Ca2+-binding RTX toxin-like protein
VLAVYTFETITAEQAAAYSAAADSLTFTSGVASEITILFLPDRIDFVLNGRTVSFGNGIAGDRDLSFASGGFAFAGTPGDDSISGSAAADGFFGGAGADTMLGMAGDDLLHGNQGADSLVGGPGGDTIYGGQDNDVIVLGSGADGRNWTNGNRGEDTITAGDGGDIVRGGQGHDSLVGGAGADFLNGNLGNDTITGGEGADSMIGEGGYDVMTGGGGADTFFFEPGSSVLDFADVDRILDWAQEDRIDLTVSGGYLEIEATPPMPPDPYDPYGGGDGYGYAPVDDYETARTQADQAFATNGALRIVATQAGSNVAVFVDTDGDRIADLGILLVNTTLASIGAENFI